MHLSNDPEELLNKAFDIIDRKKAENTAIYDRRHQERTSSRKIDMIDVQIEIAEMTKIK